ncbi:MAG: hypothetical protein KAS71_15660, partial [Bacteroidales bacterium]|nr:hypothetical protein [Bacteroidales bacterium]
ESVSGCVQKDGRTTILLEFAAHESYFVVFRSKDSSSPEIDPISAKTAKTVNVSGPWLIDFKPAREDEEDFVIQSDTLFYWHKSSLEKIKSFSGTAIYQTNINLPDNWQKEGARIILDLGTVPGQFEVKGKDIRENVYDALCAEITINDKSGGVLWCSPYRVDVTGFLQPGINRISIAVTNTLHNWRIANQFCAGASKFLNNNVPRDPHAWELIGLAFPPSPSGLPGPVKLMLEK